MRATYFEFRYRIWLMTAIVVLGFWAPWTDWFHPGERIGTWPWLGFQIGQLGLGSATGMELVIGFTLVLAALGATVRVWGTAYLGLGTVVNAEMKAGSVMADGPYRYVRNPLYIGSFFTLASLTVLMPPSGAAVALILLALSLFRLILGEEAFLTAQLGAAYQTYLRAVPRLIPSLYPRVAAGGQQPHWGQSLLGEVFPLGVLVSFATLSWRYDSELLIRAALISFGLSLLTRALMPKPKTPVQQF